MTQEITTVAQLAHDARNRADSLARASQEQHAAEQADLQTHHELSVMQIEAATLAGQHRAQQEHAARLADIHANLATQLQQLRRDALEA